MRQPLRCKHRHLLEDQDIRRWYDNLCRGSKVTADVYIRRLGAVCNARKTTPKELVAKGRDDEQGLFDFVMDLVTDLEKEGKAGSHIYEPIKSLKWLISKQNLLRRIGTREYGHCPASGATLDPS